MRLIAALPPHSAVRLCLTAESLKFIGGYASNSLRRSLKRKNVNVGKAQPFRTVRGPSRIGELSDATAHQTAEQLRKSGAATLL